MKRKIKVFIVIISYLIISYAATSCCGSFYVVENDLVFDDESGRNIIIPLPNPRSTEDIIIGQRTVKN